MWGIRGQTYNIEDVNIGGGPSGSEVTEYRGMGVRGKIGPMGDAYIIKGWGVLRQKLGMLIL